MHTVTSFEAANVSPEQLQAILAEYWKVERAHDLRREFLPQLVVVAVLMMLFAVFGVMSPVICGSAFIFVAGLAAWLVGRERRRDHMFRQHLKDVPRVIHEKVIKSS